LFILHQFVGRDQTSIAAHFSKLRLVASVWIDALEVRCNNIALFSVVGHRLISFNNIPRPLRQGA
jgi:hypothetical protein